MYVDSEILELFDEPDKVMLAGLTDHFTVNRLFVDESLMKHLDLNEQLTYLKAKYEKRFRDAKQNEEDVYRGIYVGYDGGSGADGRKLSQDMKHMLTWEQPAMTAYDPQTQSCV